MITVMLVNISLAATVTIIVAGLLVWAVATQRDDDGPLAPDVVILPQPARSSGGVRIRRRQPPFDEVCRRVDHLNRPQDESIRRHPRPTRTLEGVRQSV